MELIPLDCPSCGRSNDPIGVTDDKAQFRCRACGMVYYGPEECAEGLEPADLEETPVESVDWEITPGT